MTEAGFTGPRSEVDLWDDDTLLAPFAAHTALRESGPAVWLERHGLVALTHWSAVRQALVDWRTFSSAAGTSVDEGFNQFFPRSILKSDPPEHTEIRRPLSGVLSADALTEQRASIATCAAQMVDDYVRGGGGDVVELLLRPFAKTVLCDLVGIPPHLRTHLEDWGEQYFNAYGPQNARSQSALAAIDNLVRHAADLTAPGCLRPGSHGALLVERAQQDRLINLTTPGIDTVSNGLSAAVLMLARHPHWWHELRRDPSLAGRVYDEATRLHPPIQYFTRRTTRETVVGDVRLPADVPVLLMFGSANRDETHFARADVFDPLRLERDSLSLGLGVHRCVGAHLANLEAQILIAALAERITSDTLDVVRPPVWRVNDVLHGLAHLELDVQAHPE